MSKAASVGGLFHIRFKLARISPVGHKADVRGARLMMWPVLHSVRKSRNPETGAYPECSAYSCKSLQPQISRKSAEIPPTFQRAFLNWECASSNPPRSARHSAFQRIFFFSGRKGRQWRAFLIVESLQLRHFRTFSAKTPESLQPNSIKLPFSGDSPWRR
jgi:hypothetical protein